MESIVQTPAKARAERYSFMSAAIAVGAVVVLIGIAPRNERALFLRDGPGQARAFAAVVPPLDPVRAQLERGALDSVAWRTSRGDAAALNRGNRRSDSSGTDLIPGTVPALLTNGPVGGQPQGIGGATAPNPTVVADGAGVAPPPTGGEGQGGGGGGGVAPPSVAPAPPGIPGLTELPEPATWGMMILGFAAIGWAMRRRARTDVAAA